jgi:hypothetical protein
VQLVNYLTATKVDIGLLINLRPSVEIKRNSIGLRFQSIPRFFLLLSRSSATTEAKPQAPNILKTQKSILPK